MGNVQHQLIRLLSTRPTPETDNCCSMGEVMEDVASTFVTRTWGPRSVESELRMKPCLITNLTPISDTVKSTSPHLPPWDRVIAGRGTIAAVVVDRPPFNTRRWALCVALGLVTSQCCSMFCFNLNHSRFRRVNHRPNATRCSAANRIKSTSGRRQASSRSPSRGVGRSSRPLWDRYTSRHGTARHADHWDERYADTVASSPTH